MQILRTSSDLTTAEKLAEHIADSRIAKYKDLPEEIRRAWLGMQIYALCYILHYNPPAPADVEVDATFADRLIMEDEGAKCFTQAEMQEAFRRGISKEYGEFFGITAPTLMGFIKGFKKSEKRQSALKILYDKEQKELQNGERVFWETLRKAKEEGAINLPEFQFTPFEDDKQHKHRIEQHMNELSKLTNK